MTKAEAVKSLSEVFKALNAFDARLDDTASRIFAVVRSAKLDTIEAFNDAVTSAFQANGWHTTAGRPAAGVTSKPVPRTVRSYVWEFRVAYRSGIKVQTMKSLYDLRQAVLKARSREITPPPADSTQTVLKGVTVRETDKLLGEPFHDAVTVYQHLPEPDQAAFLVQLNRLITRYKRQVEGTLRLVA